MKWSSYLIPIFALYFLSVSVRTSSAEISGDGSAKDAIQKLFQAIQKINKKLDALDGRLSTLQATLKHKTTPDESKCLMLDVADAINNQQFEVAKEKLTELGDTDNKRIPKIVHDVYAGSAVNVDRIVGFAKSLRDGESQFEVFSAVLDEIVAGGNADPIKLIKLVRAFQWETSKGNDESLKQKARPVINKALEDIEVASITVFQTAMLANKYENNKEVENLAQALFEFTDVSNDVMDRVIDSVFGVVAAGKILDNISSHKNIPQVITGLTAIFNRFNYAGNLNNDATLNLASHLRNLQERDQYEKLSSHLKNVVENLIEQLPACAKNLYFHTYICLWNKGKQQYLYAGKDIYDDYHRNVFTWYPGDIPPGALWHVNRTGDAFYLKNEVYTEEYLFSPIDSYSWDQDKRHAFTWIQGYNKNPESAWAIELDGEFCYIKTIFNNEYLYASDIKYNEMNSYVFTWKPGSLVRSSEFQWQIRNCGQSDTSG